VSSVRERPIGHIFYPRDAMLAQVDLLDVIVCPSVRLSVTRRYCVKTATLLADPPWGQSGHGPLPWF